MKIKICRNGTMATKEADTLVTTGWISSAAGVAEKASVRLATDDEAAAVLPRLNEYGEWLEVDHPIQRCWMMR
jgi:hypothetical protein